MLGSTITFDCQGGNNYLVTLDLLLDCGENTPYAPAELRAVSDCGWTVSFSALPPTLVEEVSQLCPAAISNSTCNGGTLPGVMHYGVSALMNLPPCNRWVISWQGCCRGTTANTGNQGIYVEAILNNATGACDDSPVFQAQSAPNVCVNEQVNYNFGVTDPDGDRLVFSLISGRYENAGIQYPITYNGGYSGGTPIPGIVLDPVSGQLTFTPTVIGRYWVVIKVDEYDSSGHLIGSVMRDMVFVVAPCAGSPPLVSAIPALSLPNAPGSPNAILTGSHSIEVCNGASFCFDIPFSSPAPGITLNVVSQVTSQLPGSTFNVTGTNPAVARICWTGDINRSPVIVLVVADDGACPVKNTASVGVSITTVTGGGTPNAGTNGTLPLCATAGATSLFAHLGGTPDAGGTWLDPGGTPRGDLINPATDPAGVYTYRAGNACAYATATVTVTITSPPSAGTNGTLVICSDASPASLFARLGGSPSAGGSWSGPSTVTGGMYDPATMDSGRLYLHDHR
ncbi:MAG: hypothetical protein QM724_01430 [Flavobacteriales bacterium]